MKKTMLILMLTGILLLILVGCNPLKEETPLIPTPEPRATEPAIETPTGSPIEPTEQEPEPSEPSPPPPPPPANPLPKEGMARLVYGGDSQLEGKQIALTFDSGWEYDQTRQLLQVLEDYQVRATFFLRAGWVEDHPDLALEIAGKGHQIESHSLAHGHMGSMTREQMEADTLAANEIYQRVLGIAPAMFRPPYGEFNRDYYQQINGEVRFPRKGIPDDATVKLCVEILPSEKKNKEDMHEHHKDESTITVGEQAPEHTKSDLPEKRN